MIDLDGVGSAVTGLSEPEEVDSAFISTARAVASVANQREAALAEQYR